MEINQADDVASLVVSDNRLFKKLVMKRTIACKDPQHDAFSLQNLPKKALDNIITETSLKGDKTAC